MMRNLFSLLFLFGILPLYSQNDSIGYKFVDVISVVDTDFHYVLNNVMDQERKCCYFSDSLSYGIWMMKGIADETQDTVIIITITSYFEPTAFLMMSNLEGVIEYAGCLFFIIGENLLRQYLIPEYSKRKFKIKKIYIDEDDSWAMYSYLHLENGFVFYDKENACD